MRNGGSQFRCALHVGPVPHYVPLPGQETRWACAAQLFQVSLAQVTSAPNYWNNACINLERGSFPTLGKSIIFLTIEVFVHTLLAYWNKSLLCPSSWKIHTILKSTLEGSPNLIWKRFSVTYSHRTLHAPFDKPHLLFILTISSRLALTTGSRAWGPGPAGCAPPVCITWCGI